MGQETRGMFRCITVGGFFWETEKQREWDRQNQKERHKHARTHAHKYEIYNANIHHFDKLKCASLHLNSTRLSFLLPVNSQGLLENDTTI